MAATTAAPTPSLAKKPSFSLSYYVHTAICLIIMFGFGQLPPVAPLTPLGMNLIGIFLGVLYGWVFIEIVWPSLAGLLALMLIGGMKPGLLLNKSFGDPIVQMMFFIFVFCATINHLLGFKTMVDSGVTWGIVLLLAFVQPLSGAMAAKGSGITEFLIQILEPVFGGGSPLFFALFIGFAATALTQVMNNGAVGVAFMPIIFSYCQASGTSPELPLIMVVMGVHFAFLTPAASASAALLHGNEWSDTRAIWKTAPLAILMAYIVTAVITTTVGGVLF